MLYRSLGRTGLKVSALGFGTWGLGNAGWVGATEAESVYALQTAFSLGVNFIDTALAYGSEEVVGRAVVGSADTVIVATKIPTKNSRWPARSGTHADEMYPADWIVKSTEDSLRNLGVAVIDLQQLHTWSDGWIEDGEWVEALAQLKQDGKIRYFGVSLNNHEAESGVRLVESGIVDTVQVIYNIFEQSAEDTLLAAAAKANVGVIVRSPFDEGALTGAVSPASTFPEGDFRNQYFEGDRKTEVWERVNALAADLGISVTQLPAVALRFCLTPAAVSTAIAGMRSAENVMKNARAIDEGGLSARQLAAVRSHRWERDYYTAFYTD